MHSRLLALVPLLIILTLLVSWQGTAQDRAPNGTNDGADVLARGPVHEAFAEPVETRPQPALTVTKEPPEPINELPPDQKPEGDDAQWIPGYWSWDEGQQDFVWVSGVWRIPPPGRQWVAGYWQQVEEGWQWVPGFWAPADEEQLSYLPPPPPSIDEAPSSPAPDDSSSYVPGCWIYRDARYWWRPGFWVAYQPGWVWMPAHYCRSPYGYIFVEGYWDHPLIERGLLFAPVVFERNVFRRRDFVFSPRFVVNADFLLSSLFVWPRGYHYCFGDYFDNNFARVGLVSWIDYRLGRSAFDPNWAFYRHQQGRDWERGLVELFTGRRDGTIVRPPHTLVQQQQVIQNITTKNVQNVTVNKTLNVTNVQNVSVVAPLAQVNSKPLANIVRAPDRKEAAPIVRLAKVAPEERQREVKAVQQTHQAAQARRQEEARLITQGGAPSRPTDPPKTVRLHSTQSQPKQQPPAETKSPGEKQQPKETRPPVEKQRPKETRPPGEKQAPPAEKQTPKEVRPPTEKQQPKEVRPPAEKQQPKQTRPPTENQQPKATSPPAQQGHPRTPPPPPVVPKHEDRPIPKHEPTQPVRPPKQQKEPPAQKKEAPAQKKDKG